MRASDHLWLEPGLEGGKRGDVRGRSRYDGTVQTAQTWCTGGGGRQATIRDGLSTVAGSHGGASLSHAFPCLRRLLCLLLTLSDAARYGRFRS